MYLRSRGETGEKDLFHCERFFTASASESSLFSWMFFSFIKRFCVKWSLRSETEMIVHDFHFSVLKSSDSW